MNPPHILIIGGGFAGMQTARRLQKRLRGAATVTVVDPQPNMTYQPFLAEAAAGSIEARHIVVPLRSLLPHCRLLTGTLTALDPTRQRATITDPTGGTFELDYDYLVLALGSVSRTVPIPGLAEAGIGFTTVGEAIWLRNHVLSRLDAAATTPDAGLRGRMLTFVVIGGGYSGIEVVGELEDMVRRALRRYPELDPAQARWLLVDAADRVLPEVGAALATHTAEALRRRGVEIALGTRVESMVGGHVVLSDGRRLDSDTIVWTAGVRPHPLVARLGLPVDGDGRLSCTAELRVTGVAGICVAGVWGAGDCAAVPDLSRRADPGARCGPTAQHAVRQAATLASNIVADLQGRPGRPYRHADAGSVAGLGLHKAVAQIYGVTLRGWPAWLLHRGYHLTRVPTLHRKVRILTDWMVTSVFGRDYVSLDQVQHPRDAWDSSLHDAA